MGNSDSDTSAGRDSGGDGVVKKRCCGLYQPAACGGKYCIPTAKDNGWLFVVWLILLATGVFGLAYQIITTIQWLYSIGVDPSVFGYLVDAGTWGIAAKWHVWLPGFIGFTSLMVLSMLYMFAGDVVEGALLWLISASGVTSMGLLMSGTIHSINTSLTYPGIILFAITLAAFFLLFTWLSLWDDSFSMADDCCSRKSIAEGNTGGFRLPGSHANKGQRNKSRNNDREREARAFAGNRT